MQAKAPHASKLEAKVLMLGFLFRGLTPSPQLGRPLFEAMTAIARRPHWFVEGALPDTLDGRFAVLATIIAVTMVRLENDGQAGETISVALMERFIEVMESEHRELGIGDPTLGKTVRKLVRLLARRTALWRDTLNGITDWPESARASLYRNDVDPNALRHSTDALRELVARLRGSSLARITAGDVT